MSEQIKLNFTIADRNWGYLNNEIDQINKKAKRCGQAPLVIKVLSSELKEMLVRRGEIVVWNGAYETFRTIEIVGKTPFIADWTFVSSLEHTEHGNVIRSINDEQNMEDFRFRQVCDHCGTERRRKDSFVLRHQDGTVKQVGRSCLKLFFPGTDPLKVAEWLERVFALEDGCTEPNYDDDEESGGWGSRAALYKVEEILTLSAACVRLYGYVSRSKSDERDIQSTASRILDYLDPPPKSKASDFIADVLEIDKTRAKETLGWIENRPTKSDYDHNVKTYIALEYSPQRGIGIIASAVAQYMKAESLLVEQKKRAEALNLKHLGTVGKRQTFRAKFVKEQSYDSEFGPGHIFTFEDQDGNVLKTFTASALFKNDMNGFGISDRSGYIDKWFDLKGTVSEHSTYGGIPQTILKRCQIPLIDHTTLWDYDLETCWCNACKEKRFPAVKEKIKNSGTIFDYYLKWYNGRQTFAKPEEQTEKALKNFNYHLASLNLEEAWQKSKELDDCQLKSLLTALYVGY